MHLVKQIEGNFGPVCVAVWVWVDQKFKPYILVNLSIFTVSIL